MICVDFETYKIEPAPAYPPTPVGVAIKREGQAGQYYAWGHENGQNNCTYADAARLLREIWGSGETLLFHNAKFDLAVAKAAFGLPYPDWPFIHDTMLLLFLHNPERKGLGLKEAAAELLSMPPAERDRVAEWLIACQPVANTRITEKNAGGYIAYAPAELVSDYAIGDVERTFALYDKLYMPLDNGLYAAYNRERRLLLCLLEMEAQGLAVDLPRLEADADRYSNAMAQVDKWLAVKLGMAVNTNSGQQLIDALDAGGYLDKSRLPLTQGGLPASDKATLAKHIQDKAMANMLAYKAHLSTCLNTFILPWLDTARASKGFIYTSWQQVFSPDSGGARTGRLSSRPNFQNIPKSFPTLFDAEALPACPIQSGLPALPEMRSYIIPFDDGVIIDRDYSQQELRILAHFAGGELGKIYQDNPWADFHDKAKELLAARGRDYPRKQVKMANLGLLYGMGASKLAEQAGLSEAAAQTLRRDILQLYPGLQALRREMERRAAQGLPFRTWGGRIYQCETPKGGKTFEYKMVNTLIQGSAADCTKEAIVRFWPIKKATWQIAFTVHDEIAVLCPLADLPDAMEALRLSMEGLEFDVPMLSEGKFSGDSWANLQEYDKHGVITYKAEVA